MGEIEIKQETKNIHIHANIILYGNAADEMISKRIGEEIRDMWNEPQGKVWLENDAYTVSFMIQEYFFPILEPTHIRQNANPRNNYFRIEEYAAIKISSVDGLGSNTGYFLRVNLEQRSTAAHEFGHTMGLVHPQMLDIRGKGIPGIMYPRGTIVDPEFQYDPTALAGGPNGTMNPAHRKVKQEDIDNLQLNTLLANNLAVIGKLSNI
ncbi:MAG: peptidase M10 [Chitinophagales bacterium]|nr:peptidase M10 [Chitinophagales bacterium]